MGMKALVTGAMATFLATATMAQTLDPARVEMFRAVLKGNECVLTEAQAGSILPRFDFTREETRSIVGALVAAGDVRLDGNTLNLVDGSCETGDTVAQLLGQRDVQQFIAVMSENGCSMTEAEGERVFTERGISKDQVSAVVGPMIQAGMASFDSGTSVLTVDSAYCSAPVMAEAPLAEQPAEQPATGAALPEMDRTGMFGLSRVRRLVDVMAANNCTLNLETPDAYLVAAEIDHGFAKFIARRMISDGNASMVDGENMVLSAPYCLSTGGAAPVTIAGQPAEVPEVDMEMVATMRQIFLENGCHLNEDQMDALLPPAGFTRENVRPIFDYLENNGELAEVDGGLTLTGERCASASVQMPVEVPVIATEPTPIPLEHDGSPEGVLLSVAARNGCALNINDTRAQLAEAGLQMAQAYRIVDTLVEKGDASLSDGGVLVSFNPALCGREMQPVEPEATPAGAMAPEAATDPALVENGDPRAAVLAMLAANGCEITQAGAADMIAQAGLDYTTSLQTLTRMMASGEATSPDGGQTLQVSAPLCVAATAAPQAPRDIFINLIKQNNCSITAAEFGSLLPVDGLDASAAFAMINELEAEGVISLPPTRDIVTLSAEMCR